MARIGATLSGIERTLLNRLAEANAGATVSRLRLATGKNVNALTHMMGYFKDRLDAGEKGEMLDVIRQYAEGVVPLIVPVTLLSHYVRKYDAPYLRTQTYLRPHPLELKLRNHA